MKAIISVALLLTIVSTRRLVFTFIPNDARAEWVDAEEEWLPVTLERMAQNGEIIDGIFKPSRNGFLGSGRFGITWKGSFIFIFHIH